jgi:hypothetical protein
MNIAMTHDEVSMLTLSFSENIHYLEFGSGGSTILALQKGVAKCNSVESSVDWINKLREQSVIRDAEQCGRLSFHHADIGPTGNWGMPVDRSGLNRWPQYFLRIWGLLDQNPDLILIDGRFRAACGLCALISSRESTRILIHDFYTPEPQRDNYRRLLEFADVAERANNLVRLTRKRTASERMMFGLLAEVWNDFW